MKQRYTEEELNILFPALDHAVAATIDVRKKYSRYIKMLGLRCGIIIISCRVIPNFMNYSISSLFVGIGVMFLMLGIVEYIPFGSRMAVISVINEYRAVFYRLEKDVPGIEPPVQLWSDRIIYQNATHEYEKECIPQNLKRRTLLAEKKLQEMKEQLREGSLSNNLDF